MRGSEGRVREIQRSKEKKRGRKEGNNEIGVRKVRDRVKERVRGSEGRVSEIRREETRGKRGKGGNSEIGVNKTREGQSKGKSEGK